MFFTIRGIFKPQLCLLVAVLSLPCSAVSGPPRDQMVLWLEADAGLSPDGITWSDQSGCGNDAVSLTGQNPQKISNAINGLPVARFRGWQAMRIPGPLLSSQQYTIIAVVTDPYSRDSMRTLFSNWAPANSITSVFLGTVGAGPVRVRFSDYLGGAADNGNKGAGAIILPEQPFILAAISTATGAMVYQGQAQIATRSTPIPDRQFTTDFMLGRQGETGEYWNGDVGEVLVYNKALTTAELKDTIAYLTAKWLTPPIPAQVYLPDTGGSAYVDDLYSGNPTPATLTLPRAGSYLIGVGGADGQYRHVQTIVPEGSSQLSLNGVLPTPVRHWRILLLSVRNMDLEGGVVAHLTDQDIASAYKAITEEANEKLVKPYSYGLVDWVVEKMTEETVHGKFTVDAATGKPGDQIDWDRLFKDANLTELPNRYDAVFVFWPIVPDGASQYPCCGAVGGGCCISVPNSWIRAFGVSDGSIWLYEWLHVADGYYSSKGYYTGIEGLHGGEEHGYVAPWWTWYRDFMRGQVKEGTKWVGIPPQAWIASSRVSQKSSALLAISSTHIGSFLQGQTIAEYTLSVQNGGPGATSGVVSVTDALPTGFTAVSINGPGWACELATITCSRSEQLASGAGYPPITLTVSIPPNATSPVVNRASVSGGGAPIATSTDQTTILPAFVDVSTTDAFLPAIDLLLEYGVTSGCATNPPQYCSNENITEAQMAVFIVRSVMGSDNFTYTQTPYFTDVPTSYRYFPWIQKMQDLGIAVLCGANQFCPETPVTRGIMAVLIIRARYGAATPVNYPGLAHFTDVGVSHPYFAWIQKMKQLGITSGCTTTTYCPDDPVTRGQMAVFIMRGEFNQLLPTTTPIVTWMYPASGSPGQTISLTILGQGTNFSGGVSQVSAGPGIIVNNISVTNGTMLTAQFGLAPNAALGPRSITVTSGAEEATLPNVFRIK